MGSNRSEGSNPDDFDPKIKKTVRYDRVRGAGPAGGADGGEVQRRYRCPCTEALLEWKNGAYECPVCRQRSIHLPPGATTALPRDGDSEAGPWDRDLWLDAGTWYACPSGCGALSNRPSGIIRHAREVHQTVITVEDVRKATPKTASLDSVARKKLAELERKRRAKDTK